MSRLKRRVNRIDALAGGVLVVLAGINLLAGISAGYRIARPRPPALDRALPGDPQNVRTRKRNAPAAS